MTFRAIYCDKMKNSKKRATTVDVDEDQLDGDFNQVLKQAWGIALGKALELKRPDETFEKISFEYW